MSYDEAVVFDLFRNLKRYQMFNMKPNNYFNLLMPLTHKMSVKGIAVLFFSLSTFKK